jgi:5-methylcytosine-specific restriction endonuclease McrA
VGEGPKEIDGMTADEVKIYRREWQANNREKVTAYRAKWHAKNREKDRAYHLRWYYSELGVRFRSRHKKDAATYAESYRIRNRERIAERKRRYRHEHKEEIATANRNRRAVKRSANGKHTRSDIEILKAVLGSTCPGCRKKTDLTVDHIIPLAMGGSNGPMNLQLLCKGCNCSKQDSIVDYRTKAQIKKLVSEFQLPIFLEGRP